MPKIPYVWNKKYDGKVFDFGFKDNISDIYIRYMLNRTQSMFKYSGLPDSIPQRDLELIIQCDGACGIAKVNDNLYAFSGGLGGEPNVYYMPTIFTVANPALNYSANLKIDEECVIIPNDSLYMGLLPMFKKYAALLTESDISMRMAVINSRAQFLISAKDDATKVAADKFLKDIESGKLGAIANNAFLDMISVSPLANGSGSGNIFPGLIEFHQYLKGEWYTDIGINALFNMKREQLNDNEVELNKNSLLPLVDDMLNTRKIALEKVNAMFDTNITVDFASSWDDVHVSMDMENNEESEDEADENNEAGNSYSDYSGNIPADEK